MEIKGFRKMKKGILIVTLMLVMIPLISSLSSALTNYGIPYSYYGASAAYYYGASAEECEKNQGQDFILQVLPGACSPAVVTSDLLEEQRVPVFCKLTGIKLNPLIDVPYIRSISVAPGTKYPKEIESIVFHPYRAALGIQGSELVGSPTANDFGYVVLILRQNPVEKDMPDEIVANLSARITYDVSTRYGKGKTSLMLAEMSDDEWKANYKQYGFWFGEGYLRALDIKEDSAVIGVYFNPSEIAYRVTVSPSKPSQLIYLPGSYCSSGLIVELDSVRNPSEKAVLLVDGERIEVYEGMRNAIDNCQVTAIESTNYGTKQKITLRCGSNYYDLEKNSLAIDFNIDGKRERDNFVECKG